MTTRSKIRVYSVVSDPFRFGFLVMARTLVAQNPHYDISFRVLHHPELCLLSEGAQRWFARHLDAVEFLEVDLAPYENIFVLRDEEFKTPKRLWAAFLILDAFADDTTEHHVVCLDSDMICRGPLGAEVLRESGFAAVEARTDAGEPRGFFNTGVMALAPDVRGPEAFAKIMATTSAEGYHPSSGRADQALLSLIYSPKNAECLPWRYNVTKRHVPAEGVQAFLDDMQAVFFHYVGAKPWHVSLDIRDRHDHESAHLWDTVVKAHLDEAEHLEYLEAWRDTSRELARAATRAKRSSSKFPFKKVRRYARSARRILRSMLQGARGETS